MFPESRTSSDRPAPMPIIPVRPDATLSDAPAASRPACCAAPSAGITRPGAPSAGTRRPGGHSAGITRPGGRSAGTPRPGGPSAGTPRSRLRFVVTVSRLASRA